MRLNWCLSPRLKYFNLGDKHQLSLTSGQWVIGENYVANPPLATTPALAYNADVYLFLNQMELKSTWSKKISTRLARRVEIFLDQVDLSSIWLRKR